MVLQLIFNKIDMKRIVLVSLAAIAALAACNRTPVPGPDSAQDFSKYNVKVEPVITRATETDFENGDAIGLTLSRTAGVYAENEKLTFDGTSFSGSLKWYNEGSDEAVLKAYYPYAQQVPTSFTVQSDQSAGLSSSDFLSAVKENVLPSANAVAMVFKHRLSRIVINVVNNAGYTLDAISLKGAIPTAVIDADLLATVDGQASPVEITAYANGGKYYVILPAQTVSLTARVVAAGVDMEQKLAEASLVAGKQYTINMIVNATDIKVVLSGEIENWEDGGDLTEDVPEPPSFEEHLDQNYFIYDDATYAVKQLSNGLWIMNQGLHFLPAGKTASSNPADGNGIWYPYSSDGSTATPITDEATVNAIGYLYDYPTALGAELTADNFKTFEGAQGICPEGWHIPTQAELLSICGYSTALDGGSATTDNTAVYFDTAYNGGKLTTMVADGFNWNFMGIVNRTNNTATGKYQTLTTKTTNCSVEEWVGKLASSYIMASTAHTPANTETNLQFFGMMSAFTTTFLEGKISLSYTNYLSGYELRCVRNATGTTGGE